MAISGGPRSSEKHAPLREVVICPDAAAVARESARRFVTEAQAAISSRGQFHVALSGGSTPRRMFALLGGGELRDQVDWSRVRLFWSDERAVPPNHPESNFALAQQELLARVPVPPARIHRMEAEREDIEAAAEQYERLVRQHVGKGAADIPCFDLILLGLGADGHTASLFPGAPELDETGRLVRATAQAHRGRRRLTFTLPLVNAARAVAFLVTGAEKAPALREVLKGDASPLLPAARVQPVNGRLVFLADREAARLIG